jgi:hypothetical protein
MEMRGKIALADLERSKRKGRRNDPLNVGVDPVPLIAISKLSSDVIRDMKTSLLKRKAKLGTDPGPTM